MKRMHKLMAPLAGAALLVGCSALQIDVDVYKGSLTHEKSVQARQYAAMALAAKPVLAQLRNEMHRKEAESDNGSGSRAVATPTVDQRPEECKQELLAIQTQARSKQTVQTDTAAPNAFTKFAPSAPGAELPQAETDIPNFDRNRYSYVVKFKDKPSFYLNGLLSFYEPKKCVNSVDDWSRGRGRDGLIELFTRVVEADGNERERNEALDELTGSLIPFAERINFFVNNSKLLPYEDYASERAILQTLANSLILHANDLQRRAEHQRSQEQRFDPQRRAAQAATAPLAPAAVLQGVADTAQQTATRTERKAAAALSAASAASAAATKADAQAALSTAAAASAADAARQWQPADPNLAATHATLVKPELAEDKAAAQQDLQALTERMTAGLTAKLPDAQVTARAVANEVLAWVAAERDASTPQSPRQRRMAAVALALHEKEPTVSLQAVKTGKPVAVWAGVQQAVASAFQDSQDIGAKLQQKAESTAKDKADALTDQTEKAALAKKLAAAATADQAASTAAKAVWDAVKASLPKALALVGTAVNSEKSTENSAPHPEALRQLMLSQLVPAAGADEKTVATFAEARKVVQAMELPSGFDFDAKGYGYGPDQRPKTSMQVLDDLIAHLRTKRVAELAAGRDDNAKQLQNAIDAAEAQRTDQIFLRPASDYLRNVYASTALQVNERAQERNMLVDYLRTLKLIPAAKGNPDINEARHELEKLYWQNINRVTTAGGTNANYVIAKDDVGNWYIKAYSVDPKAVFESAKGLVLFNKGMKLDSNLLQRAELRDTARNASTPEERKAANDALTQADSKTPAALAFGGRAQERFRTRYQEETQEASNALKTRATALPKQGLTAAWQLHLSSTDTDYAALLKRLQDAAELRMLGSMDAKLSALESKQTQVLGGAHPSTLGAAILDVLNTLPALRDDLVKIVLPADAFLSQVANAALLSKLQGATVKSVNALIDDTAQQRRRSVETYQEGLASIADVTR